MEYTDCFGDVLSVGFSLTVAPGRDKDPITFEAVAMVLVIDYTEAHVVGEITRGFPASESSGHVDSSIGLHNREYLSWMSFCFIIFSSREHSRLGK
jgi:hypothetical protein